MKILCFTLLLFFNSNPAEKNVPVPTVDLKKFSGTWYSLYSIPTMFDRGSRETTTKYTFNDEGYYNVVTTYKKPGNEEIHSIKSKIFPPEKGQNSKMKCQFIWPYKVDYWVIELAEDYSYVVVGHPDHKFLFIMSRTTSLSEKKHDEILARCKAKGYDVSKLTSQMHD